VNLLAAMLMIKRPFKGFEAIDVARPLFDKRFCQESFHPRHIVCWQMDPAKAGRFAVRRMNGHGRLEGIDAIALIEQI